MIQIKNGSKREWFTGYIYILPSFAGFALFYIIPLITAFILSFCSWNLVTGFKSIKFAGFENFIALLKDGLFYNALWNNLFFTIISIPFLIAGGLLFAELLNRYCYFAGIFKILYFLPYISSIVAIATLWRVFFHPSMSPVNSFLIALGVENPPKWLGDMHWALPTIAMMFMWQRLGYFIIIYMAGMKIIGTELYEAADIDGANWMQKLRAVTIPGVAPTTFFLLITGIMDTFKVFDHINILTEGGPGDATSVLVYYLYQQSFQYYKIGFGSAISVFLFIVVFSITFIQWRGQKKWVNY